MLGERLKAVRDYHHLSQKDFGDIFGAQSNSISQYELNKRDIPIEMIIQMAEKWDINLRWFFTGRGQMMEGKNPDDYTTIPRISVKASAGHGIENFIFEEVEAVPVLKRLIAHYASSKLKCIQVQGDSMEPEYYSGDIIFFKDGLDGQYDGNYILNRNGELFCKKVQFMHGGKIRIMSANTRYRDIEIDTEEDSEYFRIIGRVLGVLRID